MNVYHGSYTTIEEIDLSKAKPNKDFGKGFYVTKYRHHAESWAKVIHFLDGMISKVNFLAELKWHEDTHQICFCTLKSLLTLQRTDRKQVSLLSRIGEPIVEKLVADFNLDEQTAIDKFFTSNIFANLAEKKDKLDEKDWTEIYKLLLTELKIQNFNLYPSVY